MFSLNLLKLILSLWVIFIPLIIFFVPIQTCFHFYILFSCIQTCLLHKKKQVGYRVTLSQAISFEMKHNDSLIAVPMHIPLEKEMATSSSILA